MEGIDSRAGTGGPRKGAGGRPEKAWMLKLGHHRGV